MLMDILPGAARWNGEVDPHFVETNRFPIGGRNDERLRLGSKSCVDPNIAADQSGDAERAPDTRSPPIAVSRFYPVCGWCRRKGMNKPRSAAE